MPRLWLCNGTSFMFAPPSLFVRHCLKFDFHKNKYVFYVQRYLAKNRWGSKIVCNVCPMPRAIHGYQFYVGTPSSLFVRHI